MIYSKIVLVVVILVNVVHAQDIRKSGLEAIEIQRNKYGNYDINETDGYDGRHHSEKISGSVGRNNNKVGHQSVSHEQKNRQAKRQDDQREKGHGYGDEYSEHNHEHRERKKEKESEGYENDEKQVKVNGIVTIRDTKGNDATHQSHRRNGGNAFDPAEIGGYIILSHEIKSNYKGGIEIGDPYYNGGIHGGYDSDGGGIYKHNERGNNFAGGGNDGGKRNIKPIAGGKNNITTNNENKPQNLNNIKPTPSSIKHKGNEIRNIRPTISIDNAKASNKPINGVRHTRPIGGARPIPTNNIPRPQSNHGPIINNDNINPLLIQSLGIIKTNIGSIKTSAAPVKTSAAPVKTSAAPVKTSAAPVKTSAVPIKTIATPIKTIASPVVAITQPIKTNAGQIKTNARPIKTNAEPIKTKAEPIKTIKLSAIPVKTNIKPIIINTKPVRSNTGSVKTNNEPNSNQTWNSNTNNGDQISSYKRPTNTKDSNTVGGKNINPVITVGIKINSQDGGDRTRSNNGPILVQNVDAKHIVKTPITAEVNLTDTEHKTKSLNESAGGKKDGGINENKPDPLIPSHKSNSTNNESLVKKAITDKGSSQKNGKISIEPVLPPRSNITTKHEDNVKENSSGPSKSEKVNSTTTGKRNIGSIIGSEGSRTRITDEVGGGLLSNEKANSGRRHVGSTIGGKTTTIAGNGRNGRRHIGSVIGGKNNNASTTSNVNIEIGNTKRHIGSTIGGNGKTISDAVKTQSGLLINEKRNIGFVIGSKSTVLPGVEQQTQANLKVHKQLSTVSHLKPHQDSSEEVLLFDVLFF